MPLIYAGEGAPASIVRISGTPQVRRHLENLGFTVGSPVSVITVNDGNVIVKVKEARIALSKELAGRIMVNV